MGRSANTVGQSTEQALVALGQAVLLDIPALSRTMLTSRADIAGYEDVPFDVLQPGNEHGLRLAVEHALLNHSAPLPEPDDLVDFIRDRVAAGLNANAAVRGAYNGMRQLAEHTRIVALQMRLSDDVVVEAIRRIWEFTDNAVATLAVAFDVVTHEQRVVASQRVAAFLHAAFTSGASNDQLICRAQELGIDNGQLLTPFRSRTVSVADIQRIRGVLHCTVDGDIAGVVPDRALLVAPDAAIGVGPPARLDELARSFVAATDALNTAIAFQRSGVFALDDLGLLVGVAANHDLGDRLAARYLAPLAGLGEFGHAVEQSLRAFLAHGLRVENAARALGVNHNTVRYRLQRYEQLTETNLQDTETAFAIWWALQRTTMR